MNESEGFRTDQAEIGRLRRENAKLQREAQADDSLIDRWRNKVEDLGVEIRRLRKKIEQIHEDVEELRMDTEETKEGLEWSNDAPDGVRMAWCNLLRSSGVDENRWFGP